MLKICEAVNNALNGPPKRTAKHRPARQLTSITDEGGNMEFTSHPINFNRTAEEAEEASAPQQEPTQSIHPRSKSQNQMKDPREVVERITHEHERRGKDVPAQLSRLKKQIIQAREWQARREAGDMPTPEVSPRGDEEEHCSVM
jgi:hypothetical protein